MGAASFKLADASEPRCPVERPSKRVVMAWLTGTGKGGTVLLQRLCYSPRETRDLLGFGITKIYRLIHEGKLDARKLGNNTVVLSYSILRLLASLDRLGPAPAADLAWCPVCGKQIVDELQRLCYSPAGTCDLLGFGITKIYKLIGDGKLDARKEGGNTVILSDSILRLLASLDRLGPAPAAELAWCLICGKLIVDDEPKSDESHT
jgi:hypothetical protein